jgi:hypothetical protein
MRLEYAAAFFLLADCLKDAVNVILNQLKDLQLAIAVTRVYEGERGPVLKELLEEKVLPLAAQEGNRWLAAWAFWMLHRRDMSVRALIVTYSKPLFVVPSNFALVSCVYIARDAAIAGSSGKVIPYRRPSPCDSLLPAPTKDPPNPPWRLKSHAQNRMGLCDP